MKYTIKDIAEITGYSKSSVSAAMNNEPGVSEKTRDIIMKKIEELNYTPNIFAKSISKGVYKTIGLIVRDLGNSFYSNLYRAIESVCEKKGYSIIIVNTNGDDGKLMRSVKDLIGRRVDGIIIDVSSYIEEAVKLIRKNNIKCVVFGIKSNIFDSVEADDTKAAYEMAKSIITTKKRQNICYIGPIESRNIYSKRRLTGILKYKEEKDFHLYTELYDDTSSVLTGYNIGNRLIESLKKYDAIMAFNDLVAMGLMKSFLENKIRIPEDTLITGFDYLETVLIPFDTVSIPVYEMGVSACNLLFDRIENTNDEKKNIVFDAEIITY